MKLEVRSHEVRSPSRAYVYDSITDAQFMYFTGLDAEVIQLAGINKATKSTFSMFINPDKPIHPNASKVTHLYKRQGKLYKGYNPLDTHPKDVVVKSFVSWLPEHCILTGHNVKAFDSRLLMKLLIANKATVDFESKCIAFADTLHLFKEIFPERKGDGKNYKQESLISDLTGTTYEAHDAKADVTALCNLLEHINIKNEKIIQHSFPCAEVMRSLQTLNRARTFSTSSGITKTMVTKMAASGLELNHLKYAYKRGGRDGVHSVLSEKFQGHIRVTKKEAILNKISDYVTKVS